MNLSMAYILPGKVNVIDLVIISVKMFEQIVNQNFGHLSFQ